MKKTETYPEVSPRTIWNFRQNSPELVVRDLRDYLGLSEDDLDFVRKIMLARGINKWLKVRRDLIAYKKSVKHEIKKVMAELAGMDKQSRRRTALKEKLKVLESVRGSLKGMCMTDRFQVWPKDRGIRDGIRAMNSIKASGN